MKEYNWGDLKDKILAKNDDMVTERNDEEPVKLRDVPAAIKDYLENELHAKLWENDAMDLPYLYVTIPLTPEISRSGTRMTTAVLNKTETKIERAGWHIIEKFEPDADCPDYTILISPYRNPHEPSIDMFDAEIARDRSERADREAMFADDEDDEIVVKEEDVEDLPTPPF